MTEKNEERTRDGRSKLETLPRAHVGDTKPRQFCATALLLFYSLLLFQQSLLLRPRPDIPRNRFSEKWKASRFPLGVAKYEIVRRCSHRRKTSVGYWGRDYSTNVCIHANAYVHVRVLLLRVSVCYIGMY